MLIFFKAPVQRFAFVRSICTVLMPHTGDGIHLADFSISEPAEHHEVLTAVAVTVVSCIVLAFTLVSCIYFR